MCYTVPLVTSVVTTFVWKRKKEPKIWWLNLMLYGGALFGIIDHLWNGEFFLISQNWVGDLALGGLITVGIFVCWRICIAMANTNPGLAVYLKMPDKTV